MASAGLLAGIGQGLQQGALGGVQAYNTVHSNQRADLLAALQQQLLQSRLQDIAEKRAAIQAMPQNLAVIGGAMNPQPGLAETVNVTLPEAPPGVDTPLPPGGGGLLNPLQVTIPGATPQRPRTTTELLAQPGAAEAYTGLVRAGLNPLGKGGVFLRPEDYAAQIKGEEDKKQAMTDLDEGWRLLGQGKDPKDQLLGMGKIYGAAVKLGKFPDQGPFFKFLEDQREADALKDALPQIGPLVGRISSGNSSPEDLSRVVQLGMTSKSSIIRTMAGPLIQEAAKQHGPGILATQRFYEIQNETPGVDPLQAWQQVKQEMPQNAARAEIDKHLPAEVASAYQVQQSAAAAGAAEQARTENMSPLDKRLKEAQAKNLENQPSKEEGRMDSLIRSYDSQYAGTAALYDVTGPLRGAPQMSRGMWDAVNLPDKVYRFKYGREKPDRRVTRNGRVEEILRMQHPGKPLTPGMIGAKERAEIEQILAAEGLL